jgi:hypothetical protein
MPLKVVVLAEVGATDDGDSSGADVLDVDVKGARTVGEVVKLKVGDAPLPSIWRLSPCPWNIQRNDPEATPKVLSMAAPAVESWGPGSTKDSTDTTHVCTTVVAAVLVTLTVNASVVWRMVGGTIFV